MPILVPVLAAGAAAAGVGFVALSQAQERASVRETMRVLDDYGQDRSRLGREADLAGTLRQRLVEPALERLADLGRRLTPVGYSDNIRRLFVLSGQGTVDGVERFLALKALSTLAAGLIVLWTLFGPMLIGGIARFVLGISAAALIFLRMDESLKARVKRRQLEIQRALPDVMDLLTISVEAGLGLEQALSRVIEAVPGPLSDEFARMMGEVRAGAARADALRAMDERCGVEELRTLTMAIIQADTYGISMARVLRSQSDEMRIKRRQRAQEQAQKTPVKMLLPITLCIFPPLLIVILVPAFINISENLGR